MQFSHRRIEIFSEEQANGPTNEPTDSYKNAQGYPLNGAKIQ